MPLISIVVPCYNAAALVSETVQSVLAQTVTDWELLLVNDGSRDGTLDILTSWAGKDPRIRCWDLQSNLGISPARNLGTYATSGRYLMHLDADDILTPTAFEEHLAVLDHAEVSYAGYASFDHSIAQPLWTFTGRLPEGGELLAILVAGLDVGSWWLPPGAVMVRREADIRARQTFDVWSHRVPIAGEMHYYACLYRAGAVFAPTDKIGVYYRKHALSDSATATFFGLSHGYHWLLEFWLKELGPDPELLRRKANLFEALVTATRVEHEFAKDRLTKL